jgi:hypothetical protein
MPLPCKATQNSTWDKDTEASDHSAGHSLPRLWNTADTAQQVQGSLWAATDAKTHMHTCAFMYAWDTGIHECTWETHGDKRVCALTGTHRRLHGHLIFGLQTHTGTAWR